jgi:hypothetical protein
MLQTFGNTASGSPMPRVYSKIRLRCLRKIRMPSVSAGTSQSAAGRLGELLVVVYSERAEEYRLISARRATRKERRAYEG